MTNLIKNWNGKTIRIRKDRYVSLTDMAQSCNKLFANWNQNSSTKSYLETLSSVIGIPITELVQVIQGGSPENQGTWGHPKVAIRFAQWCSDEFAIQVDTWVDELLNTGTVTIALSDIEEKDPLTEIDVITRLTTSVLLPNVHQILVSGVVANNFAKAFPQYKWLAEETKKHLPPLPIPEPLLTVTQLCQIVLEMTGKKISAIALNKKLQERNLQIKNQVDNPRWLPTDMGKEHGQIVLDTARGRDKTIQVLKWHSTVLDLVDLN